MIHKAASKIYNHFKVKGYIKKEENEKAPGPLFAQVTYPWGGNAGDTVLSKCVRRTMDTLHVAHKWKLIRVSEAVTDRTIAAINKSRLCIVGGWTLPS